MTDDNSDIEEARRRGRVNTTLQNHDETLDGHDQRISKLERWQLMAKGALALLGAVVGSGIVTVIVQGGI